MWNRDVWIRAVYVTQMCRLEIKCRLEMCRLEMCRSKMSMEKMVDFSASTEKRYQ